jgi:hypothetical protein
MHLIFIVGKITWNRTDVFCKYCNNTIQICYFRKRNNTFIGMTNEVRYQCPLCRRQVTLSSIGIHYHKKHPWAKIIPRLETLKPIVASLPQIETQPKQKRSIELKRIRESAVNQLYTKADLKNDNINNGKRAFWVKNR